MEKIKDTVLNVIQEWQAKKGSQTTDDPSQWLKKVLTKKELAHIKVNYFKKGILGIKVDSSAWLYNLNLKKEKLCAELKRCSSNIKDIRLRIGEMK